MNLTLAPGLLEEVIAHAKASAPHEGCGLLVGINRQAHRFIPIRNSLASPTAYEMDPQQLIAVLRDLRNCGEELIAIYHSHPFGPSYPSKDDVERSYYPEAAHLIISLAEPERPRAAGFRILDGEVIELEVHAIV